jgi:protein involved in polysaccharide export with SLBB domain
LKTSKFFVLFVLALRVTVVPLEAQEYESAARLSFALSTADYPATPGDVYSLFFIPVGGNPVTIQLVLDAGYQLKVLNMGNINAKGKTYLHLKTEVENLVSRNYPLSGPSLTLGSMGKFTIPVTGETFVPGNRDVDGLTRVSTLLTNLTDNASTRFAQITSVDKTIHIYDIFTAARTGDFSKDPYVRPGDRIHIPAAGRKVTVAGDVFRPGEYEILPEETLQELIEYYAGGFTLMADSEKISLVRINTRENTPNEENFFPYEENKRLALENRDVVFVGY